MCHIPPGMTNFNNKTNILKYFKNIINILFVVVDLAVFESKLVINQLMFKGKFTVEPIL